MGEIMHAVREVDAVGSEEGVSENGCYWSGRESSPPRVSFRDLPL